MSAVVAEDHAGKPGDSVELLTRPEAWRLSPTAVGEQNSWPIQRQDALFAGPYTECVVPAGSSSIRVRTVNEPSVGADKTGWSRGAPRNVPVYPPARGDGESS